MAGTPPIGGLQQQVNQPSGLLSPIAQIGQALGNIPAIRQNEQLRQQQVGVMQQQQAQAAEMQRLAIEQRKAQVGDQLYNQLAEIVVADPTKANDPMLIKKAADIQKTTGRSIATKLDEHGNTILDVEALRPTPSIKTMAPEAVMKVFTELQGMDEPSRQAWAKANPIKDIPPEWLSTESLPYKPPMSLSMGPQLAKQLETETGLFTAGKTSPTAFATLLESQRENFSRNGIDVSPFLTPEFLTSGLSQFAQNQLDWTAAKIGHLKNEDAIKSKIADNQKAEAFARLQLKGNELKEHIREFDANQRRMWQVHQDALGTAASNLQLRAASLDERINNNQVMRSLGLVNALSKPLADLRTQLVSARGQYGTTVRKMADLQAQGNAVPEALQKQADALDATIKELEPKVQSYGMLIQTTSANLQGGIAGVRIQPVPAPRPPPTEAQPKTKVNPANGKTYYLHSDGNYYLKP